MSDNCTTEKYNTKYTTPYYYKEKNKNNCCNGQFSYPKNSDGTNKKNKLGSLLLINKNSRDINNFGDISYPRVQNGRWNTSLDSSNNTIGYKTASQSGNIFRNTHHNMSKKKMLSYFSKNRIHFKR